MNILRSKGVVALLALLTLFVYYNFAIRVPLHRVLDTRGKLKRLERELAHARGDIEIVKRASATAEATLTQFRESVTKPSHQILSEFLTRIGSVPGIQYNRIDPKEAVAEGKIMKLPFSLEGTGTFASVLSLLQTLKEFPIPTDVEQVTLSRGKTAEELSFSTRGAAYFLPKAVANVGFGTGTLATGSVRNPFQTEEKSATPLSGAKPIAPAPSLPKLQGIAMGSRPYAIIDGHVLQIGSRILGYRVSRIESDRVILKKRGKMLTLKMEEKLP